MNILIVKDKQMENEERNYQLEFIPELYLELTTPKNWLKRVEDAFSRGTQCRNNFSIMLYYINDPVSVAPNSLNELLRRVQERWVIIIDSNGTLIEIEKNSFDGYSDENLEKYPTSGFHVSRRHSNLVIVQTEG